MLSQVIVHFWVHYFGCTASGYGAGDCANGGTRKRAYRASYSTHRSACDCARTGTGALGQMMIIEVITTARIDHLSTAFSYHAPSSGTNDRSSSHTNRSAYGTSQCAGQRAT